MSKYDRLGAYLALQESSDVHLTFEKMDALVGGLPPSARAHRPWWGNSSSPQALVWRSAGWRVSAVDLAGRRVSFARVDRGVGSDGRATVVTMVAAASPPALQLMPGETIEGTVLMTWHHAGRVRLDEGGRVAFPNSLPVQPGLYRLTFCHDTVRPRVYIGETDNLRRRLSSNYRSPGTGQQTSLRINRELVAHLSSGLIVTLELAFEVSVCQVGGDSRALDLRRQAGRRLAENLALVLTHGREGVELLNRG